MKPLPRPSRGLLRIALFLALLASGCRPEAPPPPPRSVAAPDPIRFEDAAAELGVQFRQGSGKRPLTILESTGSGCALLDYDGDGRLDLFLAGQPRCALYRQNEQGAFEPTTEVAGVGAEGFWIGCATGDYDNDGRPDLFVTGFNQCALYRNAGGGRFQNRTAAAGIAARGFQTSAVFGDVDRDGYLDLYLCRYVRFGPDEPQYCRSADGSVLRTCGPDVYEPEMGIFYRNRGDGTFVDATREFGLHTAHGKAWGAAFGDYDGDGRPDLYVANDEMPGDLFHQTRTGRFENVGAASGTGYARDGGLQGGMGVDFGDYDADGRLDLIVTNFWLESNTLYRNLGNGMFAEVGDALGLAVPTARRVGFGTRFLDADRDGALDLFFLNGHVQDISPVDPEQEMPERLQLFLQRRGRFQDVSAVAGPGFHTPMVGRGAAVGDWDNDGDPDIVAMDLEGTARLLRNDGTPGPRNHWVGVRVLIGRPARDALGARVLLEAGGKRQVREIQTGGSVLSAHDPRALFGLGAAARVDRLTVHWPDGRRTVQKGLPVDRYLEVTGAAP